jgi:undecaprenyl phosphate-alpha-L-ara4FN deformylase
MTSKISQVGLRIDVDTMRGTKLGVPTLLRLLEHHQIKATFFFSVGPDNMGRHLWRLLRPAFLIKMLRSNAAGLYGMDILLRGTFWPGSVIGKHCAEIIHETAEAGHEIGLHAWDHHRWQTQVAVMSKKKSVLAELKRAKEMLEHIIGGPILCSAAPGWRCTDNVLIEKEKLNFSYNSDCRGDSIFYPMVDGRQLGQPQIPVTLPTYDEIIGSNGITADNYNEHIFSLIHSDQLNVLTIHAEAEGISCEKLFRDFLQKACDRQIRLLPLQKLLHKSTPPRPARVIRDNLQGREGWISCQDRR